MLPRHVFRGREATLRRWPLLTDQVRSSATYHDAWISYPERLGIELLADTEEIAPGCIPMNYATIRRRGDGALEFVDGPTGVAMAVSTKVIVNATGAWLDDTREALAGPGERLVAGTKGSHLIIDNPALRDALGGHMLYFENADGRVCIVFPYLGRVLAGATDIRVDKAARVRCEDDERDYILDSLRRLFPALALTAGDIVYSFSGIRPLPQSHQSFTGRIPRDHFIRRVESSPPQICMVGGKWTTFRAFAEQTCDDVLKELGRSRRRSSRALAIGGGKDFPSDRMDLARRYRERFGVDEARAVHLTDRYGTKGAAVQAWCADHAPDRPLAPGSAYTVAEIDYLVRHEQVLHLSDLVLRRTDLAITGRLSRALVEQLATTAAAALGWSSAQTADEQAALLAELDEFHGVSLETADAVTDRRQECV
jgi:glycerol-3-phosphate dehydrogenase